MVIVIGWQVYDIARETMDIREAAFQLGLIGLVQFVPLFVLTPVSGWAADRLDRRYIARAVILLEMLCALILFAAALGGVDQPADPVRRCRPARRGPRLCRSGIGRDGAQPGAPENPAQRHRAELDGMADGRHRRSRARRDPVRRHAALALCAERGAVRGVGPVPLPDPAAGADAAAAGQAVAADGRRAGLCPPQPAGAWARSPSICSRCCLAA